MRKRLGFFTVLLFLMLAASSHTTAFATDRYPSADSLAARVDSLIVPLIKPGGPGCSIAVIRDGKVVFARGYGLADLDWNIPNSPATVFNIASLSKQFTAACAVLLAGDGKLSLDDDIRAWLPEIPDYGRKITIRNLINHTSGIRDYESLMPPAGMRYDMPWEPRALHDFIVRQGALDFAPGEKFSYSNSGYVLLAEIIRKASGLSLARFAEQRIFKPLGMEKTFFYEDLHRVVKNRATGYDYDFERAVYTTGHYDTYTTGPGGVYTTVGDLALWDRNFTENRIGGPHFTKTMLARSVLTNGDTLKYACGLEIDTYRGQPVLSHSGWWAGFLSYTLRFPEQNATVILLANSTSDILPIKYCRKTADIFLFDSFPPDKRPAPETPIAKKSDPREAVVDPAVYDRYAGRYRIGEMDAVFTVTRNDDRLMGQFNGQFRFPMYPDSDSTFFLKVDEAQVKFVRDAAGEVNRLVWCQRGQELPLYRIAQHMTAEQLNSYCGDYRSEELNTTWSVMAEDGRLKLRSPMKTIDLTGEDILLEKKGDLFLLSDMNLNFTRNGAGQVEGFALKRQGATWKIDFARR